MFAILCLLVIYPFSSARSDTTIKIAVLGDSLSAGYGLPAESGWVNLLAQRLQLRSQLQSHPQSTKYKVLNASISGEITLGGRKRIKQILENNQPDLVIIALGANDGLQGRSITSIYENLEAIILACKRYKAIPFLISMQLPPNYGISYTRKFHDIYAQLAKNQQIQLAPFLMEGFGDQPEFFQADGIHPTVQAQEKMLDNIWPALISVLQSGQISSEQTSLPDESVQ